MIEVIKPSTNKQCSTFKRDNCYQRPKWLTLLIELFTPIDSKFCQNKEEP